MKTALIHFNHSSDGNVTTWPDMRTSAWKPNYGDMLVCAAILRQLAPGPRVRVGFGGSLSEEVDRGLIRGSTYLHNKMDFEGVNRTLDSVKAPLAVVGLGAQNPTQDLGFLDQNEGAKAFIARLNERSHSISVRGEFTAAIVERLGGKNIRVTGCPSLFYSLACPVVSVPRHLATNKRSVGISLHTGLGKNMYCDAPKEARRAHVDAILFGMRKWAKLSLFEQGVINEFNVADERLPMAARIEAANAVLKAIGGEGEITAEELIEHMVSVRSIEDWLARASELHAIIGFRFHGNMVALLQGKPCYYYVYDSRITEFCDLYRLPYQDVREGWKNPVRAMLDHDWESTNVAIAKCGEELKTFYAENGFDVTWTDPRPI
ncbi:polysaccharide pyruvyl transferase family protein [Paracoccus sp. MBLB3053]|uniref:Polysaccharide pyruvyl transferase family protein n=1 Tax=Paracoccus aurantius TaxID=3073814 RepID=A0ABU2HS35_9RHOB|nr:polysaccharide pyruvyl transferase family protein [Paracoccus sp. MBLB3053]MDS9467370.1 polysaccharide pyruvyl transferase family protein [Paracoccus sp. MBLB3053]